MTGKAAITAADSLRRVADSLHQVIVQKESLLEAAATRAIQITTPAPHVTVTVPHDDWWNSALLGGAIAAVAGMLTPLVVSFVERRSRRGRLVKVLGMELGILQFRMIGACLFLAKKVGRLDEALLSTLREKITARLATGDLKVVRRYIDALADPRLLAAEQVQSGRPNATLTMRTYDTPYLESSLADLHLFRSDTQSLLFQLRGSLKLFNHQVDDLTRYHWLTFETLETENLRTVEENIRVMRGHTLDMAIRTASTIAAVLDQPNFKAVKPSQTQVDPPPEGSDAAGAAR